MSTSGSMASRGFWLRTRAMLIKEFIQLRRDRVSFAMIIMIPLMQLMLFGYAINTTPRDLPTAVLLQETQRSRPLDPRRRCRTPAISRSRIRSRRRGGVRPAAGLRHGAVRASKFRANFERALRRGDRPALLVAADATDPVAAGSALGALGHGARPRCATTAPSRTPTAPPFEVRTHARYNPAAATALNIVPGLVGTILTMTMLIFTALSVTREIERGTMESLLSMPITPVEIMLGKIVPYIIVGFVQAALIIGIGVLLFGVPMLGSLMLLAAALHAVHRHQSVDRLHLLDHRAEPAAGDADVDDVLPAEHPAVRLHVSVRRHAGLGAMDRRGAAAHALSCASCARSC